ncbi:hypothetical protein GCM10023321_41550 [Pseudonocardia eucalypti]|uniref:HEPN domain-containing protein n=1 Tax=Pseudonocardia eucalypti TaxID=648755 RepID=A0ABP9QD07_9PSEU|nr:hypothetical protein [Pseudonocardia eucalypti]
MDGVEVSMTLNMTGPAPKDPVTVYHLAQGFYLAGRRCLLSIAVGPRVNQSLVGPAVVNLCLSAELFMKSLLLGEGGAPPKTHKLDALYSLLTEEDRQAVNQYYTESLSTPVLSELLPVVSEYFVKVRYGHEFGVYVLNEYPITVFANALYRHSAIRRDQSNGVEGIQI